MPVNERGGAPSQDVLIGSLIDKIPSMTAYWDATLRCRLANRAYTRWFGVTPEWLMGKHIGELLGPLYELNRPYIERVLRGEPQEFEREIPDPKGGPSRHSLANYIPDSVEGVVRGFFVLVTDISAIKRAELALKESEARFSGIISISADAIISVDEEQRIVIFNEGAEKAFGWTCEEVIGKPLDVLLPARLRDAHRQHLRDFSASGIKARQMARDRPEIVGLRKNGEEFPAEATISRLRVGDKTLLTAALRDITERKRREDQLRVFASLIENSSDFIGIADPSGKPIYVNPAGRRMVGLPADLPVEQTKIPEYYPPDERSFAADVIVKEMISRGHWAGETYFRNWQTEERIPVSDEHFMIRDPSGERVLGMGTVTRDISEARRITAQLRESEERFRLTIDEAPIGMALVALDGRFVRVNRALCEIVGYTPEELTGLTFQAITHPADLDTDLALAGQLARGEIPHYQLEKRYLRKDGTTVSIMLHGSALRDRDGSPRYYIAQIEDITQRKRAEKERQLLAEAGVVLASSLDYEQTLSTVAQLVVRDFADWCVVEILEGQDIRRLKVASADPSKTELAARLQRIPIDRDRPYLLRPVFETRQPLLIEHVTPEQLEAAAQGAEHLEALRSIDPKSVIALPLLVRGRLLGALGLISSSPSRTYGRSDLDLASALAERAATAIENASLYRASVEATQLRDQVLGIVAHDLRNPVGAIALQASLLRRRGEPAPSIERAAHRMNRLIQDLLDVSRMEAGRLSVELVRLPATQLLHDVVVAQRELAAAASVELRLEAAADLPEVRADRDRLLQVFENLIGNAFKFTKPGGRVTVGAAPRDAEVLFWVSDTGAGIATEDLSKIFDRFWQARRADRAGAGLGLAIARGIVEAHGGRIWAESTLQHGSTFFFTVPTALPTQGQGPDTARAA